VGRSVDLNADVGEGFPSDEAVLELVSSASVACGVHAGDPFVMLKTARAAVSRGVVIGAHPSYWDRDGFGRRDVEPGAEELLATVAFQIGAMRSVAAAAGGSVKFVKPHGALYNRAAVDATVAETVVEAMRLAADAPLALLCPAGSALADRAESEGLTIFRESFADRAYRPDGTLLSRKEPGSVLSDPDAAARQAVQLAKDGSVTACDGSVIRLKTDSICVHGDTPEAVTIARAVREALERAGVAVEPFLRI
jgi:UPF0271 protein